MNDSEFVFLKWVQNTGASQIKIAQVNVELVLLLARLGETYTLTDEDKRILKDSATKLESVLQVQWL